MESGQEQRPQFRRENAAPREIKSESSGFNFYTLLAYVLDYEGRASVLEYILVSLLYTLIMAVPFFIFFAVDRLDIALAWLNIMMLVLLIPSVTLMVRRFHDTGRSGLFILVAFIPVVGQLILLIMLLLPGDHTANNPYRDVGKRFF